MLSKVENNTKTTWPGIEERIDGENNALKPTIGLAPMAGITDRVFRDICRSLGADYAVSEMVASKESLWQSTKSSTRHASLDEPSPRIVQLIGTEPDEIAHAARWQVSQGAQMIDLNMGCPAKKVCKVAAGSALMADPDRVKRIFDQLVLAVDVPVTVKIRTGQDIDQNNALEIAQLAEARGLHGVSIHGRSRAQKFKGQAEYETIRQVKQALNLPVIANGDISSPEKAQFVLKYTRANGVLIGRSAQGNPWIFNEIQHFLKTGQILPRPNDSQMSAIMLQHLDGLYHLYGQSHGVRIARKHIGWYAQHIVDGTQLRKEFNRLNSAQAQQQLVNDFMAII